MIKMIILYICLSLLEIITIYEITKQLSSAKTRKKLFILSIVLYLIFSIFKVLYFNVLIISLISGFVFMFAFTCIREMKLYKRVLAVIIFMVLSVLLETMFAISIASITNTVLAELKNNIFIFTLASIIVKFTIYFISRVIFKLILQEGVKVDWKVNILNLVMPLATLITIFVITIMSLYSEIIMVKWLAVASCMLLTIGNVSSIAIYEYSIKNKLKAEAVKYEKLLLSENQKDLNNVIQRQIMANKEIHEIKNKIFSLRELIINNNEKSVELINELCNIYKNKELVSYTGISDVDVLLNVKKLLAKENYIEIKYIINLQGVIAINSTDICMILGNLLDNAIENAEGSNSLVLEMKTHEKYLSIKCENYTTKNLSSINTTKENSNLMHGFGLIRIEEITQQYNGIFTRTIKDNKYISVVSLRLKEE